jgi:hypothetical protein
MDCRRGDWCLTGDHDSTTLNVCCCGPGGRDGLPAAVVVVVVKGVASWSWLAGEMVVESKPSDSGGCGGGRGVELALLIQWSSWLLGVLLVVLIVLVVVAIVSGPWIEEPWIGDETEGPCWLMTCTGVAVVVVPELRMTCGFCVELSLVV